MVKTVDEKCPLTEDSFYVTSQHGETVQNKLAVAGSMT